MKVLFKQRSVRALIFFPFFLVSFAFANEGPSGESRDLGTTLPIPGAAKAGEYGSHGEAKGVGDWIPNFPAKNSSGSEGRPQAGVAKGDGVMGPALRVGQTFEIVLGRDFPLERDVRFILGQRAGITTLPSDAIQPGCSVEWFATSRQPPPPALNVIAPQAGQTLRIVYSSRPPHGFNGHYFDLVLGHRHIGSMSCFSGRRPFGANHAGRGRDSITREHLRDAFGGLVTRFENTSPPDYTQLSIYDGNWSGRNPGWREENP